MTRGARIAIIAGIIIAVAIGAAVAAISMPSGPEPPADNNSTDREPQDFVVELNESLTLDTK